MKISEEQLERLNSLSCERLSSDENNLRIVEDFYNTRNETLANTLKNEAYGDDVDNRLAYYLVKDSEQNILFYFSLKCGMLYDRFIEGEGLAKIRAFFSFLSKLKQSPDIDVDQVKSIDAILESIRAKKGLKKAQVMDLLHGMVAMNEIETLFGDEQKTVGKTFSGIEIVHFCANDGCRDKWEKLGLGNKLGAVVFWHFIVPRVLKVLAEVGCEYLFLFAADLTSDEHLVNYYRTYMHFEDSSEHGAAVPLYDLTCKMMCRKTETLEDDQNLFYEYFNSDEDEI
jgi:hypothetical protein